MVVKNQKPASKAQIGWREWVLIPELSSVPMKAKVDTGAQTSTLHAFDLSITDRDGSPWVEFEVHPLQRSRALRSEVAFPVHSFKRVRSSTGHAQRRPVIRTPIKIGAHVYKVDITLTSRDEMGFRMLLGRAALRRRFLVDPGRSYLFPKPEAADRPRRRAKKS